MPYESGPDATLRATDEARRRAERARSVILVEGISDQIALEVMAERLGRDLHGDGVVVLPIGGAHAVANTVADLTAAQPGLRLSGLVDEAEAGLFRTVAAGSAVLDESRIHVCVCDLEDELIRAINPAEFEALIEVEGDLPALRTMQKQPGWRDRSFPDQMHRWLRSISGRTNTYADRVIRTAALDRLPPPLVAAVEQA